MQKGLNPNYVCQFLHTPGLKRTLLRNRRKNIVDDVIEHQKIVKIAMQIHIS